MMLLVGSQMISNYLSRDTIDSDIDYMCYESDYIRYKNGLTNFSIIKETQYSAALKMEKYPRIIEFDFRPSTTIFLDSYKKIPVKENYGKIINDLQIGLMLKYSHRFLKDCPHFFKTMRDIRELRTYLKEPVLPEYKDWFKLREKETYNYSHPSLMRNKHDFFSGDNLNYVFDHDSIHKAIAVESTPAYKLYARKDHEVFSDKYLFSSLPRRTQIAGVYEEACVLALERSLIPFEFKPDPNWAFAKALEKVCTSITSGWFREFAWENYDFVMDMHRRTPMRYVNKFNEGLKNGTVKIHMG